MTKAEYMKKLQEKLEQFNQGLQEEILEDYEQHFAEGLSMGKSEEEIIEELGNIEDMIQEFSEEDYKQEVIPAGAERETSSEQAYSGAYREIVLDGMVADVVVRESADGKLYVHYDNEDEMTKQLYRFYQYEENGIFYVGVKRREGMDMPGTKRMVLFGRTIFSFNNAGGHGGDISLELEVPKGFPFVQARTLSGDMDINGLHVGKLHLSTTSGDLQVDRVEAKELVIQAASGDVSCNELETEEFKVQTTSGDMELGEITAKSNVIRSGSGDIDVSGLKCETVNAGTGSGDVELRADAAEYTVKTGSGDVTAEVTEKAKAIRLGTGSGDVELYMSKVPGAEIHVSVGSGDIEIYGSGVSHCGGRESSYSYGDASCKVKVSTGSGDVSVNCR
ncbi:MAG: DUF4097 family beta strand repeat-containing protein [Acetatifactor sp.]